MGAKFKMGERVTRSNQHPHRKDFQGLIGTFVEIFTYSHKNRYKVKWDKKSGKWVPDYHGTFVENIGQQHSTLQAKFLSKVLN